MDNIKRTVNSLEEEPPSQENPLSSSNVTVADESWHAAYRNSIKNVDDLAKVVSLPEEEKSILRQVTKSYHMRVTPYYFSLIKDYTNEKDPIKKQCIPSSLEIQQENEEYLDPLSEEKTSPVPCLVHRYPDRVLLLVSSKCFMYCRHCTRKRLWRNRMAEPTLKDINLALTYIRDNPGIREIIISGGDPFTLPNERLDYILSSINERANVEVIRIGTRAPVVMPNRIDDNLCKILDKYHNLWINLQFNHPGEITPESISACKKLQRCGIPLSNQSVLLKGVNDEPEIMIDLCHKLQGIRVRPYYLYQCDPVMGSWHFRTPVSRGIEILEKMRGHTSGMCVPTFVVDGIDGKGKIPVGPNYIISLSSEKVTLRNYKNETFFYYNPRE